MLLDINTYPLRVLQGIEELLNILKRLEKENSNLIELKINEDNHLMKFISKTNNLDFYFAISHARFEKLYGGYPGNDVVFTLDYLPSSKNDIPKETIGNKDSSGCKLNQIEDVFNNWIYLVKEYSRLDNLKKELLFIAQYQQEFYDEFKIIDEDAEINAFNNDQQIFIYKLLSYIEDSLKKSGSDDKNIKESLEDISLLKDNLQNLPKAKVIGRLAKIFAKIKKGGLKLLMDILDVAKKEAIKKALYGGLDGINSYLHFIN